MTQFKSGTKSAFDEIYRRYAPKIHYYFFKMLNRDKIKAEDFTQDVFMKIIRKPELYDVNRRFSTWIFTIAYNLCKDEYKKLKLRSFEQSDFEDMKSDSEDAIAKMDYENLNARIYEEIDKLSEAHRTTVILKYKENFSIKDIAELMNCAEGTVKSRLFYSINKLSKKFKDFDNNMELNIYENA